LNLDGTWSEAKDDESLPPPDAAARAQPELAAFRDVCGLSADGGDSAQPAKSAGGKRRAAAAAADDAGTPDDDGVDWIAEVRDGTIGRRGITIAMLKAYLGRQGLRVSGTKPELTERVTQHVSASSGGAVESSSGAGACDGAGGDDGSAASKPQAAASAATKRSRK
jgi:hypothetical protein